MPEAAILTMAETLGNLPAYEKASKLNVNLWDSLMFGPISGLPKFSMSLSISLVKRILLKYA